MKKAVSSFSQALSSKDSKFDEKDNLNSNQRSEISVETQQSAYIQYGNLKFHPSTSKKQIQTTFLAQFYSQNEKLKGNESSSKQYPILNLQTVKPLLISAVKQTLQDCFVLKNSEFKQNEKLNAHMSKEELLWGVSFPNLKLLNIASVKISNVQILSLVDMPVISRIQMQDNKISNLNGLSKCFWPNLQYLACCDNFVSEYQLLDRASIPQINRCIIDSKKLKNNLQGSLKEGLINSFVNLDFVFKSPNLFRLKQFYIGSKNRIIVSKMYEKLKQINPKIKLEKKFKNQDLLDCLQQLGGIGRKTHDSDRFRKFLQVEVEPVLRNRQRSNPNHRQAIQQIRTSIYQRLKEMDEQKQKVQISNLSKPKLL